MKAFCGSGISCFFEKDELLLKAVILTQKSGGHVTKNLAEARAARAGASKGAEG
jgi:hypothetical protein